jgi:glutathione S-transferase
MSELNDTQPIAVGYWGIRGLAAPLRMMVMYRNIPLKAENYDCVENAAGNGFDRSAWFNVKPDLKAKNPLINLPYVIDGEGTIVTQSTACMLFLGRKLSLLGKNDLDLVQCEQLLCEIMDVRNSVIDYSYPPLNHHKPASDWLRGLVSSGRSLDKLNDWLSRKYSSSSNAEGIYFVGNDVSAPEFHIWEVLDQLKGIAALYSCEDPLTHLPKLNEFHQFFRNLPGNRKYFSSKLARLPANNTSAETFGATPEGKKYVFGQETSWLNSSGMY